MKMELKYGFLNKLSHKSKKCYVVYFYKNNSDGKFKVFVEKTFFFFVLVDETKLVFITTDVKPSLYHNPQQ